MLFTNRVATQCGGMKNFIFTLLVTVSAFAFISCDRHEWDDSAEGSKDGVKNLFHPTPKSDDGSVKKGSHGSDDDSSGKH